MKRHIATDILFLVLIGVLLFISTILIYGKVAKTSEYIYCYNLRNINDYEELEECKKYITNIEKVEINLPLEDSEKALAIYIAKCWNKANKGYSKREISCYSIEFTNDNIFNEYLRRQYVLDYLSNYSDVNLNRVVFIEKNPEDDIIKDRTIGEYRSLLIYYNGSHIIIW